MRKRTAIVILVVAIAVALVLDAVIVNFTALVPSPNAVRTIEG